MGERLLDGGTIGTMFSQITYHLTGGHLADVAVAVYSCCERPNRGMSSMVVDALVLIFEWGEPDFHHTW